MTAQERDQLQQFLAALRQQRSHPKDTLAEGLIRDALAQQPHAPYWLVHRNILKMMSTLQRKKSSASAMTLLSLNSKIKIF